MNFSECFYKIGSSQNCSRFRPHRVMFFKNWKIAKIRQISSIFHKFFEFFDFDFCTNHERSIFGIKISFFFLEKLPKFFVFLWFCTAKICLRKWSLVSMCSPSRARFNALRWFSDTRLVEEISAKYWRKSVNLKHYSFPILWIDYQLVKTLY